MKIAAFGWFRCLILSFIRCRCHTYWNIFVYYYEKCFYTIQLPLIPATSIHISKPFSSQKFLKPRHLIDKLEWRKRIFRLNLISLIKNSEKVLTKLFSRSFSFGEYFSSQIFLISSSMLQSKYVEIFFLFVLFASASHPQNQWKQRENSQLLTYTQCVGGEDKINNTKRKNKKKRKKRWENCLLAWNKLIS